MSKIRVASIADLNATMPPNRSVKIICTLGPASNSVDQISVLLSAGMNVARLNFSHGDHPSHLQVIKNIREACALTGRECAILLDTKGPEIRTGLNKGGGNVNLQSGQQLILACNVPEDFEGTEAIIRVDYKNLPKVVQVGSKIKIDDGLLVTVVTAIDEAKGEINVVVANNVELGQRKGVNLPGTAVDLPALTAKDKADLLFGVENKVDFIAASFIRKAQDVIDIKAFIGEEGAYIKIISKIENQEGLDNFREILEVTDAIMVARGDLGVEIPIQKVMAAQKMMISMCNRVGKPVVTATQMLESMVKNPRPTRAEAGDVGNAVFDGTDAVMLSGETAKGSYPSEAVAIMSRICLAAESAIDRESYRTGITKEVQNVDRTESIAKAAVHVASDNKAAAIITLTETGNSARMVSKYMPAATIIAATPHAHVARQLRVSRGCVPLLVDQFTTGTFQEAVMFGISQGLVRKGDQVVVIKGDLDLTDLRLGGRGTTNCIQVITADDSQPNLAPPADSA